MRGLKQMKTLNSLIEDNVINQAVSKLPPTPSDINPPGSSNKKEDDKDIFGIKYSDEAIKNCNFLDFDILFDICGLVNKLKDLVGLSKDSLTKGPDMVTDGIDKMKDILDSEPPDSFSTGSLLNCEGLLDGMGKGLSDSKNIFIECLVKPILGLLKKAFDAIKDLLGSIKDALSFDFGLDTTWLKSFKSWFLDKLNFIGDLVKKVGAFISKMIGKALAFIAKLNDLCSGSLINPSEINSPLNKSYENKDYKLIDKPEILWV
jgi:hypothetical protein